ncbi:hypothetical protein Zmor_023897 [Zophobas morio]|uniref:Uncharacterized protein n=1 Tax=Zophobas morio TaxID=2755281 RepID=A0AA38HXZ4_9CUCU|nr:hypothetical protein Zmor_023849 [Zophobas morio]KAJ3646305.1 hypothetical protein Zmor_023897 [Zophobas morio]
MIAFSFLREREWKSENFGPFILLSLSSAIRRSRVVARSDDAYQTYVWLPGYTALKYLQTKMKNLIFHILEVCNSNLRYKFGKLVLIKRGDEGVESVILRRLTVKVYRTYVVMSFISYYRH